MSDFPNAKGAVTYRKAGLGARKMGYSHLAIGLFFLFLSIGGIYRYMGSNQAIASLGLTVMVIVSVKIYHWQKQWVIKIKTLPIVRLLGNKGR